MKINIYTKNLAKPLEILKKIAKPSTTHAILGNVALVTDGDLLRVIGQDLEKRMEIALACKIKEQGSITLNSAYLADLLGLRGEPECEISTDGMMATIKIGKHVGRRPGLPVEDMPQWPEVTGKKYKFTIPAILLSECLSKAFVQTGAITGERSYLNSVFLVSREGLLNIQSTSGTRLVIFYTNVPFECGKEQFVIPKESILSLVSLCGEQDVEFELGDNILTASTDAIRFSTLLIEAPAMDFERVFPKKKDLALSIVTNRLEFISEIKTAQHYVTEQSPAIVVKCDGKEITIEGTGAEGALGACSLDAGDKSAKLDFACNPSYLLDALNAIPDDNVTLRFESNVKPCVIKNDLITSIVYLMKA